MKFILFTLIIGTTSAAITGNMPSLSVSLKDGAFNDFDQLDPTLNWSTTDNFGDYNVEVGLEASAKPTTDLASLPRSIFGKASRKFGAWGVTARADIDYGDWNSAAVEIDASNPKEELSVKLLGTAGSGFDVSSVSATKSFSSGGARVTVKPKFDMATKDVDVSVEYDAGKTVATVDASKEEQTVTVSQQLDNENRVAPSFSLKSGKMSVEWERSLGGGNTLNTKVTPNESVDLEWNDGDWCANINMALEGTNLGGPTVSISRDLSF